MTLEEILKAKGLTEEQVAEITKEMTEHSIYLTNEENLEIRYNKLKNQKDELDEDLKQARETISNLEEQGKGNEELQKEIESYKQAVETEKQTRLSMLKEYEVKNALKEHGAQDVDYLVFKLGGLDKIELGEDGKVKDLDPLIEDLKTNYSNQFTADDKVKIKEKNIDDKTPRILTADEIKNMSPEEINENWEQISEQGIPTE